jgi:dihydroxyacetone kinase
VRVCVCVRVCVFGVAARGSGHEVNFVYRGEGGLHQGTQY